MWLRGEVIFSIRFVYLSVCIALYIYIYIYDSTVSVLKVPHMTAMTRFDMYSEHSTTIEIMKMAPPGNEKPFCTWCICAAHPSSVTAWNTGYTT